MGRVKFWAAGDLGHLQKGLQGPAPGGRMVAVGLLLFADDVREQGAARHPLDQRQVQGIIKSRVSVTDVACADLDRRAARHALENVDQQVVGQA